MLLKELGLEHVFLLLLTVELAAAQPLKQYVSAQCLLLQFLPYPRSLSPRITGPKFSCMPHSCAGIGGGRIQPFDVMSLPYLSQEASIVSVLSHAPESSPHDDRDMS